MNNPRNQRALRALLVIGMIILALVGWNRGWFNMRQPAAPAGTDEPAVLSGDLQTERAAAEETAALQGVTLAPPDYSATTLAIQEATGIMVERDDENQIAKYEWYGNPLFIENGKCTAGLLCVADAEINGLRFIATWIGGPNVKFDKVYGITIYKIDEYPAKDPVHDSPPCEFHAGAYLNGQNETPSFTVVTGNFSCEGAAANIQALLPDKGENLSCPLNARDAMTLLTGSDANASNLEIKEGHWHYKPNGAPVNVTVPFGRITGWDGTKAADTQKIGETVPGLTEFNFYCS